jgi:hypothetical protein
MSIERSLPSLRDIEGVYGSFAINAAGELTARDLPAVFDDITLVQSGERIVRLWEVISENGAPEYTLIEFAEYCLFLRGLSSKGRAAGCLCVVVPPTVNLLALRLAAKWVARSFDRESSDVAVSA